ncbi:MAG: hypothetical protein QXI12_10675 [Candidatus Methanomethyliaceae archaeon]
MLQLKRYFVLFHVVYAWNKEFGPIDHLSLQRLIYLLSSKLALGYKFYFYYYGPYSPEIWGDLRALEQDGLVVITTSQDGGYVIRPAVAQWPLKWAEKNTLSQINKILGPSTPQLKPGFPDPSEPDEALILANALPEIKNERGNSSGKEGCGENVGKRAAKKVGGL